MHRVQFNGLTRADCVPVLGETMNHATAPDMNHLHGKKDKDEAVDYGLLTALDSGVQGLYPYQKALRR